MEEEQFFYDSPYDQACYQAQVNAIESNNKRPWILTDYDTWIRNPNYKGPPVPPPDFD